MRHLKAGKRLGVTTSHRKAMMRNLVTSLLEHGEIKTTVTRAKEMRKYFDRMIGLGKRNDLHAKRQAMSFIKSKEAFRRLFEEYGPLYAERNGGYTRIYRLGNRLGDNAQMALIQMVGLKEEAPVPEKPSKKKIEEIQEELQQEKGEEAEVIEEVKAEAETEETAEVSEPEVAASETEEAAEAADAEPEAESVEEAEKKEASEDKEAK